MASSFDPTNPLKPTIQRDPNSTLDYTFDWTKWLADAGGDAISSVEFLPMTTGTLIVEDESSFVGAKTTVWLSGGTINTTEYCTHRITTAAGRVEDRTMYFKMKAR